MSKFNRNTYERIRDEVRHYLDLSDDDRKSILFYGNGGEGKTYLISELYDEMRDAGYSNFMTSSKGLANGRMLTRSQANNTMVVSSVNPMDKYDVRFKVFDFTE